MTMYKFLTLFILIVTSTLIWAHSDSDNVDDGKAQHILSELRKDLNALQAEFKQYELTTDGRSVEENTGTVWMQAPDYFKWHYETPFEQLIVADGKQV